LGENLEICRIYGNRFRDESGYLFENLVVSKVIKHIRMIQLDMKPYFYRTRSGLEFDLLFKTSMEFYVFTDLCKT